MRGFKIVIFGMITVSLEVKIVNVFVFLRFNAFEQHSRFRALHSVFRAIKSPSPEGPTVPVRLC